MSEIAIKVENLYKQYRLGEVGLGTLNADLHRWWSKIRGKEDPYLKIGETNDRTQKGTSDFVWALKDINFEVKKGEILGIIGKNGAGKSTLLKILSSTTAPTQGNVKINGRIASLLEVGTGFHPDLSGRENIFLNGAILGMKKREITAKFDEIVDFSGVERYIDTPVKRYSSGMYVRLAFGVAAHLEPDILIVDEVLAVGDFEFQKKCLGKMKEVSENEGRTVLFVSHQMGSIAQLCTTGIVLKNGTVSLTGPIKEVILKYLNGDNQNTSNIYENFIPKNNGIYFKKISVINRKGENVDIIPYNEEIIAELYFDINRLERNVLLSATIQDKFGNYVSTSVQEIDLMNLPEKNARVYVIFPKSLIAPNFYFLRFALFKQHIVYDLVEQICPIKIIDYGSKMAPFEGIEYGSVLMDTLFKLEI